MGQTKEALQSGRRGSEVIVTTRLEKVAFIMAKVPFHCLLCLSDDDSWSSFKKRAFVMGINEGNVNHETIGKQIVQRCGGVPLAINAIGSILCFKTAPPVFNGEGYHIWVVKMKTYLQAFDLWEVINSDVEPEPLRANPTVA
ncbi:disease resistance protein RGA2-like [Gossypium hirsutum]|uniref:Disease resistance protein RGA2-like n=1 Tax=Gossypium hirsutum TaxID=3635 RepID=A0A1U8KIP7_GOSHI|nr:disease resistance protein RGA2-like [Gossypium hirsutum]